MDDTSTQQIKDELRRTRAGLRDDLAAADQKVHVDIPAQISSKAPLMALAGLGVGAIIGYAGRKGVKALLAAGGVTAAGAVAVRKTRAKKK
jgi:hypothetical protein